MNYVCVARGTRGSVLLTFGSSCTFTVFGVSKYLSKVNAQVSCFEYILEVEALFCLFLL